MQSKEFVASSVHFIIKGQQETLFQPVQFIYLFSKSTSYCVPTNLPALNTHSKRENAGQLSKGYYIGNCKKYFVISWKFCQIGQLIFVHFNKV